MSPRSKATTLTTEFHEKSIKLRGTTYVFREVSGATYEECVKTAEGEDGTADLATVLKLMIPESLVSPKMSVEEIYAKPLPVLTRIQSLVNELHFQTEPDETDGEEPEKAEAESGDEAKNESEPVTF